MLINFLFPVIKYVVIFFDIIAIVLLFYWLYAWLKGTIGLRIFLGFVMIYGVFWLLKVLGFQLITALLGQLMEFSALAVIILFQQEIRALLFRLGRTYSIRQLLLRWRLLGKKPVKNIHVSTILKAIPRLQKMQLGAIIVLSQYDHLKHIESTGESLEATISVRLLLSIFCKQSPLHDGAVLVYGNRIKAAGCILPVADVRSTLGLRHRSAMGIARIAEVLVVIVSEETGEVAIAQGEKIFEKLTLEEVCHMMHQYLQR